MLSKTLKSIREGGNILASYPAQINMLVNQNAVLKKRIIKLEEDRDYWIQAHAQQLSECNRFEDAYRIAKIKLHNSQPSLKTIEQAIIERQLVEAGF